jgi:hypothetical protein
MLKMPFFYLLYSYYTLIPLKLKKRKKKNYFCIQKKKKKNQGCGLIKIIFFLINAKLVHVIGLNYKSPPMV